MNSCFPFCIITLVLMVLIFCCDSSKFEEDITITQHQKELLNLIRIKMDRHFAHDYMKKDIYLIRWLRATDFNLEETQKRLLQNLRWRRENNIDHLDDEEWSYFKEFFSYSVDSVDNTGQPLLIFDQTNWKVREAIVVGKRERLIKWMVIMLEDATMKVREAQKADKNVTRFTMLNSLEHFNLLQSGCIQCLSVYMSFTNNYEMYYPNMMNQMILVNTPGVFDAVMRLVKPLMTPGTRNALRLMGTNKKQWQAELLREIPADQLPSDFGGTKQDDDF